jgi:Raf kinase inhibitor-like YbhB/YbcL family protein
MRRMFGIVLLGLVTTIGYTQSLTVTSPDFENEGEIPERFTCDGEGTNPTLNIAGIPEGTKSLVIIMEDPDVPLTTFNHWLVWNIPPQETIQEGTKPGVQGNNSLGKNSYMAPCPPAGTHRYFFKVFALNSLLDLDDDSNKRKLEDAMKDHVLAKGELIGVYNKK